MLKILIKEWSDIFDSNWALKPQRKRGIEILQDKSSQKYSKQSKTVNNNVNIEQGQLNFDWFTHYCVVTKRYDWLKEETHILSLKRVRGLLMNIHEFRNTLIRVSYAI